MPLAARTSESRRSCYGRTLWAVGLAGGGVTFKKGIGASRGMLNHHPGPDPRVLSPPAGPARELGCAAIENATTRLYNRTSERLPESARQRGVFAALPAACWLSAATRSHVSELESRQSRHPRGGQLESGMVGSFYTMLRAGGDSLLVLRSE